jgi:uncharacterized membrane protein YgdD (TMEM256/DUF423 family)
LVVSPAAGLTVGVLLSLVALLLVPDLPEVTVLGAYAIVVFLVSASLTSSPKRGLFLGLFTALGQTITELIYFISVYAADVTILPFAVGIILFVGRIVLFPLTGGLGGYVGREYSSEKPKRESRKIVRKVGKKRPRA